MKQRAVHPKQTCACFGCKRWSRQHPPDWSFLCRDHWRLVPQKLRRLHIRAKRRAKKHNTRAMWRREAMIWKRCVDAATHETTMGLGI